MRGFLLAILDEKEGKKRRDLRFDIVSNILFLGGGDNEKK
jgi:hypothetical protein